MTIIEETENNILIAKFLGAKIKKHETLNLDVYVFESDYEDETDDEYLAS